MKPLTVAALLVVATALSALATWALWPRPAVDRLPDDDPAHLAAAYAALEETGLALEAFRAREGRYPAALDELVPRDLARLPRDPFAPDRGPLRYGDPGPRGEGRVVYSVGPDRTDQGGAPRDPLSGRGDLPLPVF